ncbi:carboxymuconolactone decarboxylase family protein [Micromonospora cathayae]|uniref:Carboxymuconolactone decarboxylase family protein n=1 Tax=Micromonospora cathayae TaxID=3028804 RepID=A0ABY7ZKW3_9ACTN|nr:carboxymuconolactone decarboxylase family protein [Micromonospora sp. HUAS 3]WDZ83096.1 carboxymuconolactone decarboxylase family protein [Micromonospora sp. HUAS 3]
MARSTASHAASASPGLTSSEAVPPGPYTIELLGRELLRLPDDLDVRRVHYAGLSLGAMVGMWLAGHAPDRTVAATDAFTTDFQDLGMHVRAAPRNGLTRQEISEVLLQVGIYAGVPAANRAFAAARQALPPEQT